MLLFNFNSNLLLLGFLLAGLGFGSEIDATILVIAKHAKDPSKEVTEDYVALKAGEQRLCQRKFFDKKQHVEDDQSLLLGLFDGHGQAPNAQLCAHLLCHGDQRKRLPSLLEKIDSLQSASTEVSDVMKRAFRVTNIALSLQFGRELQQSGSTAVVAHLKDGILTVANVGDSEAYIIREDHSFESLTTIHDPASEHERIERAGGVVFENEEGFHHGKDAKDSRLLNSRDEGGLAVSRAFGDFLLTEAGVIADPSIVSYGPIKNNDKFLVLASDGLWDVLAPKAVAELIMCDAGSSKPAESRLEHIGRDLLEDACLTWQDVFSGDQDDISIIIVDLRKFAHQACTTSEPTE